MSGGLLVLRSQRRLCERSAVPVIAGIRCEDITTRHMQQIVNAAPTPGEGRARRMVGRGLCGTGGRVPGQGTAGAVHWQARDRALRPPQVSYAGESVFWGDPAEVSADADVAALTIGQVDPAARVISGDRKVVGVGGHPYVEPPKNRKYRRTISPSPDAGPARPRSEPDHGALSTFRQRRPDPS
jgi:hypothetical protein